LADGGGALPVVKTTCPYCGVGCGVEALAAEGRVLSVAGDRSHPANHGKLCSKGLALGSTVGLEGRLLNPMIGEKEASWSEATALVARKLKDTIARHGPDSVGFYVSGQLLTEDYYAANKLMKGFIGSGNIDTNSRLCMASAVAAHKLAFGADLVPGCYEDLELADLVVFSGHNAAFTHPVLLRRMEAARKRGQRHVVIDPRRTDTAEGADLHLPIAPQTDVRLWNGLLAEMMRRGVVDRAYVAAHVSGFEAVEAELLKADQSPAAVSADCGITLTVFEQFCGWFAGTPRTVSLFSMGANQSAQGVAKGLSIINVHLATGRIGKPGACPFSITGQPNAMGGRETGGMANTLAAHMDFAPEDVARVARFWGAPQTAKKPGLKAVEMFEAVREGRIRALWIMATNPAVSLPDASLVREALSRCPVVIVSDVMERTDTSRFAHIRLPALAWGEKDGTVTNSERRISRQRPLFAAPGQARGDWQIVSEVAQAMGFGDAFGWRSPHQVFREYARLTAYENEGRSARTLNLGPLVRLGPAEYEGLAPVQWPVTAEGGTARLFADAAFPTPDGRARMHAVEPKGPATPLSAAYPLSLNTGRIRDQWHTMTRTGLAPELCRHAPEPFVEVHPEDAAEVGVQDGALTRIETARGTAVALARVTDRQRRGGVFMPMHWTDAFAPSGRSNPLIGDARDPISGQPEFKHTPARVRPYRETWKGFCVSRRAIPAPAGMELVWRRTPQVGGHLHEFAGRGDESERAALRRYLVRGAEGDERLMLEDAATGMVREAYVSGDRLDRVVFMTATGRLPPRAWLAGLLAEPLTDEARASLLHGRPPGPVVDQGAIVCACLGVGANAINAAVAGGCGTVEAVGAATGAGTNCGSCRIEIGRLIALSPPKQETRDAA
jgi:assimilatory nitrate reductase catalytic subunit